jgi:hypothetical protein
MPVRLAIEQVLQYITLRLKAYSVKVVFRAVRAFNGQFLDSLSQTYQHKIL